MAPSFSHPGLPKTLWGCLNTGSSTGQQMFANTICLIAPKLWETHSLSVLKQCNFAEPLCLPFFLVHWSRQIEWTKRRERGSCWQLPSTLPLNSSNSNTEMSTFSHTAPHPLKKRKQPTEKHSRLSSWKDEKTVKETEIHMAVALPSSPSYSIYS